MRYTIGVAAAAAVAITAVGYADGQRSHSTAPNAILAPNYNPDGPFWGSTTTSGPLYATGFEAADGFSPGPINGQQGWTNFAANDNIPAISTANPASGSQHLRNSKGPGANSSFNGAFSPDLGAQAAGRYITSVDFASNDPGGADHMIVAQAPSQGFLSWRLHFDWQGNILVLDDVGSGLQFINTGSSWSADGQYRNLTVDMDYDNDTIDYYYDGSLIYSSVAGVFAGTAIEQVVLFGDNWYNPGGWGDWDNLILTQKLPAPGAIALLGLAGLVGVRRRRS